MRNDVNIPNERSMRERGKEEGNVSARENKECERQR